METTAAPARYIDSAEAAKLIRKHLKATFPGVKFSVRTSRYSGGASVDITWTDGPTEDQVQQITGAFAGERFDGRTDCAYNASSWYCPEHGARVAETYGADSRDRNGVHDSRCCANAELVQFLSDYINRQRRISPEFREELRALVARKSGLPADAPEHEQLRGGPYQYGRYDTVSDGIYRASVKTPRNA
ncbi:LPD29 domain-containing protein [Amycolatopsis thermophila]|uniref:Large polyvalent protein associated domain-containing protein n=1 Tax=Amycolatopsis thermophila TaxID=206084 RepID=A0ABU0EP53_9PSEU|nr:LPD29 domain-containing protein [Amycolatopsis thermophila]MDQ0376582.1 hypothetical protein [Amycolatopsis thermophila]